MLRTEGFRQVRLAVGILVATVAVGCGRGAAAEREPAAETNRRWIDPRCTVLPWSVQAHIVRLGDGRLLTLGQNKALVSSDEGRSWRELSQITNGHKPGIPEAGGSVLLRTRDGAIVLFYMDMSEYVFRWDSVHGEPSPDTYLDLWCIRSLDEGTTWIDRHKVMHGYCGALINIIETRDGHIVVPVSDLARNPGRFITCTYMSADRGKTWTRSNAIDLGGAGHHDGACEATAVELSDGRVLMLIRTARDRFWEAFSEDHGLTWREFRPSQIESSNSPAYLLRLSSGRIAMFWNRLYPEGQTRWPRWQWHRPWAHRPASWHRTELSLAFSDDDCRTWSRPNVIARQPTDLSYPYAFEHAPGKLWIDVLWTQPPPLHFSLNEADFIR